MIQMQQKHAMCVYLIQHLHTSYGDIFSAFAT